MHQQCLNRQNNMVQMTSNCQPRQRVWACSRRRSLSVQKVAVAGFTICEAWRPCGLKKPNKQNKHNSISFLFFISVKLSWSFLSHTYGNLTASQSKLFHQQPWQRLYALKWLKKKQKKNSNRVRRWRTRRKIYKRDKRSLTLQATGCWLVSWCIRPLTFM